MKTITEHGLRRECLEEGDSVYVQVADDKVWEITVHKDGGITIHTSRGTIVTSAQASNTIDLAVRRNDGAEGILFGRGLRSNAGEPDLDTAVKHAEGLVTGIHNTKSKTEELRLRIKAGILAIWPW